LIEEAFVIGMNNEGQINWTETEVNQSQRVFKDMMVRGTSLTLAGSISSNISTKETLGMRDAYIRRIQLPETLRRERGQESGIKTYPNPNNGQFTLSYSFSKVQQKSSVIITDVSGRVVYENFFTDLAFLELALSLGTVGKGVYTVKVISDEIELFKKIVIK
jgi:hypothetical protein